MCSRALLAPAALALLTVAFPGGKDRGTAFAIFGSITGVGAAAGVLLGGFLTEHVSWRWCFFVNVPDRPRRPRRRMVPRQRKQGRRGPPGTTGPACVLAALGLGSLVYGFTNAEHGWDAPEAWGFIAAGAVLMVLFVAVERKVKHPLLPLRVATERNRGAAFLASFLSGAVLIGGILFINFYIQIVLGFAPFLAGLASLPMTVAVLITAGLVAKNLPKLGAKIPTAAGPVFLAAAMLWLSQVSAEGSYLVSMLPALLLMGVGLGMVFVPMQNLALFGVDKDDSGVASALVNASQQIGGSLGIALFSTIAAAATAGSVSLAAPSPATPWSSLGRGRRDPDRPDRPAAHHHRPRDVHRHRQRRAGRPPGLTGSWGPEATKHESGRPLRLNCSGEGASRLIDR